MTDWILDFIKRFEGFSSTPYMDEESLSIGYGCKVMPDGSKVTENSRITQSEADKLMASFINNEVLPLARKTFPKFDQMPEQLQAVLIDIIYRGNRKGLNKSTNFIAAINNIKDLNNITQAEAQKIISEMGIDNANTGITDRKQRRAAMVLGLYNPEHNNSIYSGKSEYKNFNSNFTNSGTMWGQVNRTRNLNQDFVKRLWDPNRESIDLGNGYIDPHKLSYVTEGDYDVVFPMIQTVYPKWWQFGKKPELVDFTNQGWEQSYKHAIENNDTIHVPSGMGKIFTTRYKKYYPGFKSGGKLNYLNLFK